MLCLEILGLQSAPPCTTMPRGLMFIGHGSSRVLAHPWALHSGNDSQCEIVTVAAFVADLVGVAA